MTLHHQISKVQVSPSADALQSSGADNVTIFGQLSFEVTSNARDGTKTQNIWHLMC